MAPSARRGSTAATESAVGRALSLLRPELRPQQVDPRLGYLDLLAGELESTGFVHELMQSGAVSRIYERWWRPVWGTAVKGVRGPSMAEEHRIARSLLELAPGAGVLDVACGPGNFSRDFARAAGDAGLVVGIDASRAMLEQAARQAREAGLDNLAFVRGDAGELPFRDRSFDAVCCFAALHLFADPFAALDHMRQVLTPGGRIAIFTSCRSRSAPLRTLESVVTAWIGTRMFEQREIVEALRERGFVEISQRVSGFTQFVGGRLAG